MKKPLFTLAALALTMAASGALAKLPAPSPEAKAKAAETAARTAWSGKVDAYQLCKSQDAVAAKYRSSAAAAGKTVPEPLPTPACTDPGAFVYTPPEPAKPIEAAGAHSPAETAAAPPNTNQPAATTNPTTKP